MRRTWLFWRVYATYLVVVLLCTGAVGLLAVRSARDFYLDHTESELRARAGLVREELAPLIGTATSARLERVVQRLGAASSTRITLISAGEDGEPLGKVLAETDTSPGEMENHRDRPEFRAAVAGRVGTAIRHSATLDEQMMYVAIPVEQGGRVVAAVRAAVPLTRLDHALQALYLRIGLTALVVALAAALIGLFVTSRISRQMRDVTEGAGRFAAGDFSRKLLVPRTEEFAAVAESLNTMADDLDEKIRTLTHERNEREVVLASMVEGVLAVDPDEHVLTINEAAARLLGVTPSAAAGRSIQEVVRNPELQRVVAEALAGDDPVEAELVLRSGTEDLTLQAHGTRLRGGDDEGGAGALVVLNDVTRLKRLEDVRRDFVANVSHELKTPVTSIKGFTETLLDGAVDDPEAAGRFLRIIAGQADRLNSIIEDLLALSALEATQEGGAPLEEADVCDVVTVATEVCAPKAQAKDIRLDVACAGSVFALINPPLLEQAVVNLVDNAIKYSPDGSTVEVRLDTAGDEVVISVGDHGPGIAREHLARLFERFYRVDKARSRDLGGTGLGLSIVKHIAQVHGGRVEVDSKLGVGSTFTLHLPLTPR